MKNILKFKKSFTQQIPIPRNGITRAIEIMESGKLHRYNVDEGEDSESSLLEKEYAAWQGCKYCVACSSGGYAIALALRVCGVKHLDKILTNAYTLAPVPGAIHNVGAVPIFIESNHNFKIDLDDLEQKAIESQSKFLLLSHMRGHIADMTKVMDICDKHGIDLIEDCAHTMGARYNGIRSGNFGKVSAFSTQTYKHMNSGEGGLLTTNDPEIAARAVVSSGSYMLYQRHGAIPNESMFEKIKFESPNYSGRMDQVRAAMLRAQLPQLENNIKIWNLLYSYLLDGLSNINGITIPKRNHGIEFFVGSSIQFRVESINAKDIPQFIESCASRGIDLKWFGAQEPKAFTSRYDSWKYIDDLPELPKTILCLEKMLDMRIPLTFNENDCNIILQIIKDELASFTD